MKHLLAAACCLVAASPAAAQDIPADGTIAFGSNREGGRHEVFTIKADGSELTRVTQDGGTNPTWSPDGKWILYYHPTKDHGRVIRPDGTGDKKICDGTAMSWMHDGSGAFCDEWTKATVTDPSSGQQTTVYQLSDFSQLDSAEFEGRAVTHDGRYVVGWSDRFRDGYEGNNGYFKADQAAIVLDLQDKSKLYFLGEGCEPTTPPAGDLIFHVRGDGPTEPDIFQLSTKDLATRSSYKAEMAHADNDWGHEYFPRISNDNQWLTYAATTDGCHNQDECDYEVFVHRLGGGNSNRTQVTNSGANDQWPHMFVESSPVADAGPPPADTGPGTDSTVSPTDSAPPRPDGGPSQTETSTPTKDSGTKDGGGGGGCAVAAGHPEQTLLALLALLALRRRDYFFKRRTMALSRMAASVPTGMDMPVSL